MKLSYEIIKKLQQLTKCEIDFLFNIGQYQDGQAVVTGIDWRSVCNKIGISRSNYYKVSSSLVNKGFLVGKDKNERQRDNWEFEIAGNQDVFRAKGGVQYLNLNFELLHSQEFISLKKAEKLLCLNLIQRSSFGEKEIKLKFNNMCEITGATYQTVKLYAKNLKENLFKELSFIDDAGLRVINQLDGREQKVEGKRSLFSINNAQGKFIRKVQMLVSLCKQQRIKYDMKELEDTVGLFRQYNKYIPDHIDTEVFILQQIAKSIKENNRIIAKYVHACLREAIESLNTAKDNVFIPKEYNNNFISFKDCYNQNLTATKIKELLQELSTEYVGGGNSAAIDILKITEKNLTDIFTATKKEYRYKKESLTHRQIYDKVMDASRDRNKEPSPDELRQLIRTYIDDVITRLPTLEVKTTLDGYLQTWLIDAIHKKAVISKAGHINRKAGSQRKNRFQNFEGRDYDFDAIERAERIALLERTEKTKETI